jgi:hypothetical protein
VVKNYGKKPITKEWQQLTKSITIRNQENTGVVCGKVSNLTVIDFDHKLFYKYIMGDTKTLEDSRCSERCHVHFLYNPNLKSMDYKEIGIEIKNNGKQVAIPPSIHFTGDSYVFNDESIISMPLEVEERLKLLLKHYDELNAFNPSSSDSNQYPYR